MKEKILEIVSFGIEPERAENHIYSQNGKIGF